MLLCLSESRGALEAALASLKSRSAVSACFDPAKTLVRFQGRLWLKALIAHEQTSLSSLRWLERHHALCGWVNADDLGRDFRRSSAMLTSTLDANEEVLDAYAALHDPEDDAKTPKRYALLLDSARRLGVINEAEVGQLNGFVDGEVRRVGGVEQCVHAPHKPEDDRRDTMRHMMAFALVPALVGCRVQLHGLVKQELNGTCGQLVDVPNRFEGRVGVVREAEPSRVLSVHLANLAVESVDWGRPMREALPDASMASTDGRIVEGCSVRLIGLNSRPELNGCGATALRRRNGRWAVRVTVTRESILVKPENLELMPPPPWEMLEAGVLLALGVRGTAVAARVCTEWHRNARVALDSWRQLRLLRSTPTQGGGVVSAIPQAASEGSLLAYGCYSTFSLARVLDATIVEHFNGRSAVVEVGNPPPPLDPANIARTVVIGGRTCHQLRRRPPLREALGDIEQLSGIVCVGLAIYVAEDAGRRLQKFVQNALDGSWEAVASFGSYRGEDAFQHRGLTHLNGLLFTCDISNNRVVGVNLDLTRCAITIGTTDEPEQSSEPPSEQPSPPGSFCEPWSLDASGGCLYVLDCVRIQAFASDGTLLRSFDHADRDSAPAYLRMALCAGPTCLYVLEENEEEAGDRRVRAMSLEGRELHTPTPLTSAFVGGSVSRGACRDTDFDMCILGGLLYVSTNSALYTLSTHQPPSAAWSDFSFHVMLQYKGKTRASWKGATIAPEALVMPGSAPVLWRSAPKWWIKAQSDAGGVFDLTLRVEVTRRAPDGTARGKVLLYSAEVDDGTMADVGYMLGQDVGHEREEGRVDFQSAYIRRPETEFESDAGDDSDDDDFGSNPFRMVRVPLCLTRVKPIMIVHPIDPSRTPADPTAVACAHTCRQDASMSTEGIAALNFYKVRARREDTGFLMVDEADPDELTRFFESGLRWA